MSFKSEDFKFSKSHDFIAASYLTFVIHIHASIYTYDDTIRITIQSWESANDLVVFENDFNFLFKHAWSKKICRHLKKQLDDIYAFCIDQQEDDIREILIFLREYYIKLGL